MVNNVKLKLRFILLLLSFASCNVSKFPIDDIPKEERDDKLIGRWTEHKRNDRTVYVVGPRKQKEYSISLKMGDTAEEYSGYLSKVGNKTFLNVLPTNTMQDKYCMLVRIFNISADGKRMQVAAVADTNMQYLNSPAEVRQYVEKHCNERPFYADTGTLYKMK